MVGSLIGGGLKVAGSIYGGIKAAQAARQQRNLLKKQQADNNNYLARKYYEDATQRADAQAVINSMKESLASANRNQAGTNAVMGASNEVVAAQKQAASNAIADTMQSINAAAVQNKDNLEANVRAQNAALTNKIADTYAAQAQSISQMADKVGAAGADIADAWNKLKGGQQ